MTSDSHDTPDAVRNQTDAATKRRRGYKVDITFAGKPIASLPWTDEVTEFGAPVLWEEIFETVEGHKLGCALETITDRGVPTECLDQVADHTGVSLADLVAFLIEKGDWE